MSDDDRQHPSIGLVPDPDEVTDVNRLDDETSDSSGELMGEDYLENELPEEGVMPEDVTFEEDLEGDLQEGTTEGKNGSDADDESSGDEYARRDTDYEQNNEDEEIERYGADGV